MLLERLKQGAYSTVLVMPMKPAPSAAGTYVDPGLQLMKGDPTAIAQHLPANVLTDGGGAWPARGREGRVHSVRRGGGLGDPSSSADLPNSTHRPDAAACWSSADSWPWPLRLR